MGKFEDIELYKHLRQGKINLFISIPAYDNFDGKNLDLDSLYFEENIVDETEEVVSKIQYIIRQIIATDYVSGEFFDEFYIKFAPMLFYRVDTIDKDPNKVVAETECLYYDTCYVKLMIDFITVKDGLKSYKLGEEPIIAVVDYEKFVRTLNRMGYGLNYQSFYELSRDILKIGREDDRFPELYASVFDLEDTKRYQQDAELEIKLKSL